MGIGQQLIDGVSNAGILIIIAIGLSITFGVMKIINMAHGDLIMVGAYTTYLVTTVAKLPFVVGMIAAFIVSALVGYVMEVIVIKRLYGRHLETLLATFGLSIILQQLARMIFGPEGKSVAGQLSGYFTIGEVVIPYYRLFIILFSIGMVLCTAYIIFKTKFGMQLRTVSENREMSECLGIHTAKIDTYTFCFGAGISGVAGAVLAPMKEVAPAMGFDYLLDAFMVVVAGGIGSLTGTGWGSFMVGEMNQLLTIFSSEVTAKIIVFLLVILIIRFKPEGLFKMERR
jgi:urea transport system permease protein